MSSVKVFEHWSDTLANIGREAKAHRCEHCAVNGKLAVATVILHQNADPTIQRHLCKGHALVWSNYANGKRWRDSYTLVYLKDMKGIAVKDCR